MDITTLGAIAAGIRQGRENVRQRKLADAEQDYIKQQRAYLAHQQEWQMREQERQMREQERSDRLKESMAASHAEALANADGGGTEYVLPSTGVRFDNKTAADAYRSSVDGMSAAVVGGGSPMAGGIKGAAKPTMQTPKIDIQEIVRPKKNGDALFYQGPWQSKLRAEYEAVHGTAAAMAMDAKLKDAAERGYRQRILEAAELQKAGDNRALALKLNEIYNRDYVDGAFSNVRLLNNNNIEVVRFLPDGRIVDRTVQPLPDMINQARQLLSEEKRVELLVSGMGNNKPLVMVDQKTGESVLVNPNDPDQQRRLPGIAPAQTIIAERNITQRELDRDFRARKNAIDNARADRRAAEARKMTEAQLQAQRIRDIKIKIARKEVRDFLAKRRAQGLPETVPFGHPMSKTFELAKEPLSSEVRE